MKPLLIFLLTSFCLAAFAADRPEAAPPRTPQFIGILRLTAKFHPEAAWTKADHDAVGRHFARLQELARKGTVILAGRTLESNEATFGVVIFEARDSDQARAFMDSDPAVAAGIMTYEMHSYFVAVARQ